MACGSSALARAVRARCTSPHPHPAASHRSRPARSAWRLSAFWACRARPGAGGARSGPERRVVPCSAYVNGSELLATAVGLSVPWLAPGLSDRPTGVPVPPPDEVAHVVEPAYLRASPGGRVIARVGRRTQFGSDRVHPIVRRRGDWVGVIAPERQGDRLAWLPAEHVRAASHRVRLHVDLSARTVRVIRGGRVVRRVRVAVGAPGTPTPTGRFAVTDRLKGFGPYGCCILALSARQPNLAQGWSGGDRIAIHGTAVTSSIGTEASNGCLRATDRNMRRLVRLAPPGTRVLIRR